MSQLQELEQQISVIDRELEKAPKDATLWMDKGVGLYLCGQYEASVEALQEARRLDPDRPAILYNLANSLVEAERLEEAADAYLQTLDQKPDHIPALNNLADLWEQLGEPKRAHELFHHLTHLVPDDSMTHFNLGNFFLRQDQPIEACKCYQTAIDLDPEFGDAWFNIGWVLQRSGALQQAEEYLVSGLERVPDHEEMRDLLKTVQTSLQEQERSGSAGCSCHSQTQRED